MIIFPHTRCTFTFYTRVVPVSLRYIRSCFDRRLEINCTHWNTMFWYCMYDVLLEYGWFHASNTNTRNCVGMVQNGVNSDLPVASSFIQITRSASHKNCDADHDSQMTISSSFSPHQPRLFLPYFNKPSTEGTCHKGRGWLLVMKTLGVHYQCWLEVTKQGRYRDKQLCDETYFWALKVQFPTRDTVDFTRAITNRAISKGGGMETRQASLFRWQATGICPLTTEETSL